MAEVAASSDEQERWLAEAVTNIKKYGFYMRKSLDESNVREALRFAAALLGELRTSLLSPRLYYQLYMAVFDQMRDIETFFADQSKRGCSFPELYELVQHAGNVLPRLYLLATVGAAYARSGEVPSTAIMRDLVDMCRGVQHPTRGLFLRSYLCQVTKGVVIDAPAHAHDPSAALEASVDFLITNLTEMNKLWVRMQQQGAATDKTRREMDRAQLQELVGRNLTVLAQLEGITPEFYRARVLPRVLEQVIACKDDMAQQYLMDCLVMAFPDEVHLLTLDLLLAALSELEVGVKVHVIIAGLLTRLADYAKGTTASDPDSARMLFTETGAVDVLRVACTRLGEGASDRPPAEVALLYIALMTFITAVQRDRLDLVNDVLLTCASALGGRALDTAAEAEVARLLELPVHAYGVVPAIHLEHFPAVLDLIKPTKRREIAATMAQKIVDQDTQIDNVVTASRLLNCLRPLLADPPGEVIFNTADPLAFDGDTEFCEEQDLVARVVHLLGQGADPATRLDVYRLTHDELMRGGAARKRRTLPALAMQALALARSLQRSGPAANVDAEVVLRYVLELTESIADTPSPELALQIMLDAGRAAAADRALEQLAFHFFERAFLLFEGAIYDQRGQVSTLQAIVGQLLRCFWAFSEEDREALAHQATGYAAKLLRKADRCKALLAASKLYWCEGPRGASVRNAAAVRACLDRAVAVAGACKRQMLAVHHLGDTTSLWLLLDVANESLAMMESGCPSVTQEDCQLVVRRFEEEFAEAVARDPSIAREPSLSSYYGNTKAHAAGRAALSGVKFQGIPTHV